MIKNALSKTQIDRLGDRLKKGLHTESNLRLLDDYRRSFGEAYEAVVRTIRQRGEFPTGRLSKSTHSIVEKLRRESIRLSQMQDIAGCRVVVANIVQQDQFVASLKTDFIGAVVMDRRDKPSYGYRAVHVIVEISGKPIEIQVRTSLQHGWAELSEKSSDVLDPTIKYGGGPESWRNFLTASSESVASYEKLERTDEELDKTVAEIAKEVVELSEHHEPNHDVKERQRKLEEMRVKQEERREELVRLRNENADLLTKAISLLDKPKGQK